MKQEIINVIFQQKDENKKWKTIKEFRRVKKYHETKKGNLLNPNFEKYKNMPVDSVIKKIVKVTGEYEL